MSMSNLEYVLTCHSRIKELESVLRIVECWFTKVNTENALEAQLEITAIHNALHHPKNVLED